MLAGVARKGRSDPWLVYLTPRWHFEVSTAVRVVLGFAVVAFAILGAGLAASISPLNELTPVWAAWLGIGLGLILLALGLRRRTDTD